MGIMSLKNVRCENNFILIVKKLEKIKIQTNFFTLNNTHYNNKQIISVLWRLFLMGARS